MGKIIKKGIKKLKKKNFSRKPTILAFPAAKGGVGKTMLSANITAYLANRGYKTLLLGADVQEDATTTYLAGKEDFDAYNHPSLSDVLFEGEDIRETVYHSPEYQGYTYDAKRKCREKAEPYSFDIICAGSRVNELSPEDAWRIKEAIEPIKDEYDFIIFDTPSRNSNGTLQALAASDYAAIPVNLDDTIATDYSIESVFNDIGLVEDEESMAKLLGVILNMYNESSLHTANIAKLKDALPTLVFETVMRRTASIPNANALGIPLCSYPFAGAGVYELVALAEEMLDRISLNEEE